MKRLHFDLNKHEDDFSNWKNEVFIQIEITDTMFVVECCCEIDRTTGLKSNKNSKLLDLLQ